MLETSGLDDKGESKETVISEEAPVKHGDQFEHEGKTYEAKMHGRGVISVRNIKEQTGHPYTPEKFKETFGREAEGYSDKDINNRKIVESAQKLKYRDGKTAKETIKANRKMGIKKF